MHCSKKAENQEEIVKNEVKNLEKKKYRNWNLQLSYYYETHNNEGIQTSNITESAWRSDLEQRIKSMLSEKDSVAYCFHDKDILSDGMLKPLHCHIELMFSSPRYQNAIMKKMKITREENCQPVRAKSAVARYLTHRTNEAMNDGKYQYNMDEVICFNCDYRELIKQTSDKKQQIKNIDDFIGECSQDIRAGKYWEDIRELLEENFGVSLGEKLWKKYRKEFKQDYIEYISLKAKEFSRYGRNLTTLFITASESGVGKSQLAKAIAYQLSKNVHFVPASGKGKTYDFVGTYKGEPVSVFNEVDGSEFGNKGFNDIFDPFQYSPINSRGQDKHWLATTAILTTTESREDFITNAMPILIDSDSQKRKLKRREVSRRLPYEIICIGLGNYRANYTLRVLDDTDKLFTIGSVVCNDVRDMGKMNITSIQILELLGLKESDKPEKDFTFLKEKITIIYD